MNYSDLLIEQVRILADWNKEAARSMLPKRGNEVKYKGGIKMQNISVEVKISGVVISGDVLQIIKILSTSYGVSTRSIHQLMKQVSMVVVEPQPISTDQAYFEDSALLFTAKVRKGWCGVTR